MPCTAPGALLRLAQADGYAVPALDVETCDMARAVVAAAEEARAPVIVQVVPEVLDRSGWGWLSRHLRDLCEAASVPASLHLDHARRPEVALRALDHGFTSVMYDGSFLDPAENRETTARVVAAAHRSGLDVEGEIGHVGREGEPPALERLTAPADAQAFVGATGVDFLAVAVGTRHGRGPGPGGVDLGRLAGIRAAVDVPLVLHGGSGVPAADLEGAIAHGVAKVNVGSALSRAYLAAVAGPAESPGEVVERAVAAVREAALRVFAASGSSGRA